MVTLDIVIVVRAQEEYDLIDRLMMRNRYQRHSNVNFIIVDDGSPLDVSYEIENACVAINARYVRIDSADKLFSLSRGRNAGILASKADYLLFEDLDLFYASNFYDQVVEEIEQNLETEKWSFLVFPVLYLSEVGTALALSGGDRGLRGIIGEVAEPNSALIEFYAPVSSLIVCPRWLSRAIGGFDEAFEGWGFEDSDFVVRLLRESKLEKPRDFYHLDTRNYSDQVQWRGWRSFFRLHGDLMAGKGLYAFHAWHKPARHKSDITKSRNRNIFLANCAEYKKDSFVASPLVDPFKPTQLFISRNPHAWGLQQFRIFDNAFFSDEIHLSALDLDKLVLKYQIDTVVLPNPYANPHRLSLYKRFLELNIECIVVERGALPGSIYFDPNGFCAESTSYASHLWDKPLNSGEVERTKKYISTLIHSGATLEPQGNMIGGAALRYKLFKGDKNVKILFAAFQSPSDTTTNFFCGELNCYDEFVEEIRSLPLKLPNDWKLAYKNHPLSNSKIIIDGAICVDDNHIGDVLEMASAVTVLNSGVGVLAIAYNKPVFCFGQTFYACDGLTYSSHTADEIVCVMKAGIMFDTAKALRFIKYLHDDFYSFASWTRKEREHTDVAKMSISVNIVYQVLRCQGYLPVAFNNPLLLDIRKSLLFDRYRLDDYIERHKMLSNKSKVDDKPLQKALILNTEQGRAHNIKQASPVRRKFRKLVRSPSSFFKDALVNRLLIR